MKDTDWYGRLPTAPRYTIQEAAEAYERIKAFDTLTMCPVCRGHGADPMSDNTNWLTCQRCGGKGRIPNTEIDK